jgi:hypothetical protein
VEGARHGDLLQDPVVLIASDFSRIGESRGREREIVKLCQGGLGHLGALGDVVGDLRGEEILHRIDEKGIPLRHWNVVGDVDNLRWFAAVEEKRIAFDGEVAVGILRITTDHADETDAIIRQLPRAIPFGRWIIRQAGECFARDGEVPMVSAEERIDRVVKVQSAGVRFRSGIALDGNDAAGTDFGQGEIADVGFRSDGHMQAGWEERKMKQPAPDGRMRAVGEVTEEIQKDQPFTR